MAGRYGHTLLSVPVCSPYRGRFAKNWLKPWQLASLAGEASSPLTMRCSAATSRSRNSRKITSLFCQTLVKEFVDGPTEFGPELSPMKPIVTAAALVAGFVFTTTNASASDPRVELASEAARSVIQGIILGGKVGPDIYGFVPANIESRVAAGGFTPTRSVAEQLSSPPAAQKRPRHTQSSIHYAVPRRPHRKEG